MKWYIYPILIMCFSGNASAKYKISIDLQKTYPISPYIYGLNKIPEPKDRSFSLYRMGGNRWTAYNWENNASNAGSDWHFQNDNHLQGGEDPAGAVTRIINASFAKKASVIVTVPICCYVAADKRGDGDASKTANYLKTRFKLNRHKKGKPFTSKPDLGDPYVYQDEFIWFLKQKFNPTRTNNIFFALDNEPGLWSSTHKIIHPNPATYNEVMVKSINYALSIKRNFPTGEVIGPVLFGWSGFINLQDAPDHKNRNFIEYYLKSMKLAEKKYRKRLLDGLDLHYYSEARGSGIRVIDPNNSNQVVKARIHAPRSLYDPQYVEDSWITKYFTKGPLRFFSDIKSKINSNYSGTKIVLSEWSFGGGDHYSGSIATSDMLGAMGKGGVYVAAYWPMTNYKHHSFVYAAYDLYRQKPSFTNIGLKTSWKDWEKAFVYASKYQGKVVAIIGNRSEGTLQFSFSLKGAKYNSLQPYKIDKNAQVIKLKKIPGSTLLSLPAMSVFKVYFM